VSWVGKCTIVIPCFDEAATIVPLIGEARQHVPDIVVVDDGSRDETAAVASHAGAAVIRHPRNLGKGAALRTGLRRALKDGFEWAFSMDGDGQHRPGDLPFFLQCAERTGAVLVVGNRMHNPQAIPWIRRQVNRWMSRRLSQRAGRALPDSQCGFRLLNLRTWAALPLRTAHFEIESETLLAFLSAGHRVEFVPIQVVGRGTHSHINPLLDTWRWLRWWWGAGRGAKSGLTRYSTIR